MNNNFANDTSGTKIRACRLERGMTQEGLAEKAGLAVSTIIRIELGKIKNPGLGTLKALAKALDVLAIEVDGYEYHKEDTVQASRDLMKDRILELYGVPMVRFRTNGSGEKEAILEKLNGIMANN